MTLGCTRISHKIKAKYRMNMSNLLHRECWLMISSTVSLFTPLVGAVPLGISCW